MNRQATLLNYSNLKFPQKKRRKFDSIEIRYYVIISIIFYFFEAVFANITISENATSMSYTFQFRRPSDEMDAAVRECQKLSHSGYLSRVELDRACEHRSMWLRSFKSAVIKEQDKISATQKKYLRRVELPAFSYRRPRQSQSVNALELEPPSSLGSSEEKLNLTSSESSLFPSSKDGVVNLRAVTPLPAVSPNDASVFSAHSNEFDNAKATRPKRKAIRKEFRMLTNAERTNLTLAMNRMKFRMIDNVSAWDLYTIIHYPEWAVGAHWGPAFLPWHREFLRQFEAALRREVADVALPYWDSTLDYGLPDPADSVMWTDELMGNGNGYVKTGPFGDWSSNVLMPLSPVPVKKLFRSTGARPQDRLLTPKDVDWIISRANYSMLTFCHDKTFESMHGLSHVWVGGFMFVIRVSPNDPVFYMHHAFIDFVWEQFRQARQSRHQRQYDYAKKICNRNHGFNAQMAPFNLKNRDGLSNEYTDFWYEYEPVRHCTANKPYCDSQYLFCDMIEWRCRSRVQLGGNCTGFAGTEICYNSMCIQNVCRIPATAGNGFERREHSLAAARSAFDALAGDSGAQLGVVWTKTLLLAEDSRPLSSGIAHVTIHASLRTEIEEIDNKIDELVNNVKNMQNHTITRTANITVFMQRTTQYPEIPGIVYLPLPHLPNELDFEITLEARDHYGRYCQSYCFNATANAYQVCEPKLYLIASDAHLASNISYTHSYGARRFLDMDFSVHPSQWRVHTPYMLFACHRKLINSVTIMENAALLSRPLDRGEYVWFRVTVLNRKNSRFNLDNLQIETENLVGASDFWLSSIRRARSSYDQSVVFVRARNPRATRDGVRVRVAIRDEGVRLACDVKCDLKSDEEKCDETILLHDNTTLSQEAVFSSDPEFMQLLGWRMTGRPSNWLLKMPYLTFYC